MKLVAYPTLHVQKVRTKSVPFLTINVAQAHTALLAIVLEHSTPRDAQAAIAHVTARTIVRVPLHVLVVVGGEAAKVTAIRHELLVTHQQSTART